MVDREPQGKGQPRSLGWGVKITGNQLGHGESAGLHRSGPEGDRWGCVWRNDTESLCP